MEVTIHSQSFMFLDRFDSLKNHLKRGCSLLNYSTKEPGLSVILIHFYT